MTDPLDGCPGRGPAVRAPALRGAAGLEAGGDRGRGRAVGRTAADDPGLRPGEHPADGAGRRRPAARPAGERRRIPPGTLIGIAAAIKLTPALFVVFAFLIGRRRLAITAIVSFVVATAVGAVFLFPETVAFFGGLSGGDTRTASPLYAGNQSLLGVFFRLGDTSRTTTLIGLAVAGLLALLGAVVGSFWWRHGHRVFAVAIVGLCTNLASPLSWTHHYVWILVMAVALLPIGRPAVATVEIPRWARRLATFWVLWVCLCLPLALLPYGKGQERTYGVLEQIVANIGPLVGLALVVGLAWPLAVRARSRRSQRVD